jgi:protein SSD1
MTDQAPTPSQSKDEKKPATSNTSNQNVNKGGQKKNPNRPNNPGQGRRKPSSANESGSDTGGGRKGNDNTNRRTSDNRGKSQGGRGGNQKNRIPSQSRPSNSTNGQSGNRQASKSNSSTPAPATGAETSDALSSLQRIIADLKTASPAVQPYAIQQTEIVSSLPADAPIFRPGMQAWPGLTQSNDQAKHRKAASVGTSHSNNTIGSYSPNLGVMMEDPEDAPVPYEPGEIHGDPGFRQQQQAHSRRSLSQSFSAPRFAALAQQDQGDGLGPTGRPQLAPGFIFGAAGSRRRGSTHGPVGPPINEEDIGFQFPQQQIQGPGRHDDGGEITGIMAEQVNHLRRRNLLSIAEFLQIAIQKQIEALQQQQQALYQQQLASNQILSLQNPGFTPTRPSAHRRVQSTVPVGISGGNNIFGAQNPMGQLGNLNGLGMGLDGQTAGIPRGHGRRHSVNVLNKAVGQSIGSFEDGGFEPFDDGFNLPGQQQRGAYPNSFLLRFQLIPSRPTHLHHTLQ